MFGIGLTEMLVIGAIALIFIGPDQLPSVARTIGKFINDLRRSSDELKSQFREQTDFKSILNDPPPVVHQEPEFIEPKPHKGDNLGELFPDQFDENGNPRTPTAPITDEEKKKG